MILLLIKLFKSYHAKAKIYEELSRLNDRELLDIGLSRSDIPSIVNHTYGV